MEHTGITGYTIVLPFRHKQWRRSHLVQDIENSCVKQCNYLLAVMFHYLGHDYLSAHSHVRHATYRDDDVYLTHHSHIPDCGVQYTHSCGKKHGYNYHVAVDLTDCIQNVVKSASIRDTIELQDYGPWDSAGRVLAQWGMPRNQLVYADLLSAPFRCKTFCRCEYARNPLLQLIMNARQRNRQ